MTSKKRIKPGKIEVSADKTALIINYTTEVTTLDEDGNPNDVEKVPGSKEIPVSKALSNIGPEDVPGLALDIVEQCKYIPTSKTKQVETLLQKLHPTWNSKVHAGDAERRRPSNPTGTRSTMEPWAPAASTNGSSRGPGWRPSDFLPAANEDCLDDYAEALYEDTMEAKAAGAKKILRLCTNAPLLEIVASHSMVLGVISRELRENAKRSHDLTIAVTGVFACFSHFTQFHSALTSNQCGDATMKVLEYELKRRTMLKKELKLSQGEAIARGSSVTREQHNKLEKDEQQYRYIMDRQDGVFLLCILTLRNLAEDLRLEKKMVSGKICQSLGVLLCRSNEDLLLAALGFVQKLSAFEVNKNFFVQSTEIMARLANLVGHQNVEIALTALRICFNLSFDPHGRTVFISQTPLLARTTAACQQASLKSVALKVLYMLSMEEGQRAAIANSGQAVVSIALQLCSRRSDSTVDAESAGLCINLAADEACAHLLVKGEGFGKLMMKGLQQKDVLLMKILRHCASHAAVRHRLILTMNSVSGEQDGWLLKLIEHASRSTEQPEVTVEALGILSALDGDKEVAWSELLESGLLEILHRLMMVGLTDDDVLLECVLIVGSLARHPDCAKLLSDSKIPKLLAELIPAKQADVDLTIQLIFTARCLIAQPISRSEILESTDVVGSVLQMLHEIPDHTDDAVFQAMREQGEDFLDDVLGAESDGKTREIEWAPSIRAYRFEKQNGDWCRHLTSGSSSSSPGRHGMKLSPQTSPEMGNRNLLAPSWQDASSLMDACLGSSRHGGFGSSSNGRSMRHR